MYYVESPDYNTYMDTQQSVNIAIVNAFEKEKISMAFPTRTLYMRTEGDKNEESRNTHHQNLLGSNDS